jgi:PAS domain S-box-containing protein
MPIKPKPAKSSDESMPKNLDTPLQNSEMAASWLAAIIESADDAIISKTLDGIITSWNRGAQRMFGFSAEEVIGVSITILIPPDHLDEEPEILRKIKAGERVEHYETVRRRKDGSLVDISLTVSPIKAADGTIIGASKIARDIGDQKRAAEALAEQNEIIKRARAEAEKSAKENERLYRQAQESSRLKEEFLATVSHELRNPLNAILGWSRLLRAGQIPEDGIAKALETIERNAHAQTQLIDDLLDVSRIITGKLRMDVRPADPSLFIEAAIEAIKPAAEAKGVRMQKVMDTGVVSVPGDPVRLQQVVWNLLSNAIKFTPRGGRVQLLLERVNSHVEIIVSDTGQGISPEFLPHVFDRFRQADQRSVREHGGMGLGLAIVKHLVELHGGSVEASSPGIGQGATFTLRLPVVPVYQMDPDGGRVHPSAPDLLPAAEFAERLDGLTILVVDDEPDTRELLKTGLQNCGAKVTVAASAAEALKAIKTQTPDLMISDIGMPGEDGYDLIRKLRSLPARNGGSIPAIALTAYARVEDRLKALRSGYQMHVPKPVELAELVAVADSLVKRSTR